MSDLSLDNIVTNNMNFKHLETTKDITISIKNENGFPQRPDATHTWTAKVSDGTNYVGDYTVKINQNSLIVDSEDFTKLPVGSYQLEVWEEWIDPDGTKQRSIYPSPSQTIPFTIYANLTDQAEKEIKSIGFQDVVDQAVMNIGMNYVFKINTIEPDQTATVVQSAADGKNYVTFNIPQGPKGDQGNVGPAPTLKIGTVTKLNSDQTPTANVSGDDGVYTLDLGIPQGVKGDTGTVDNTGLISVPAFQSLQTQVNNSAVGTNLYTDTKNFDNPAAWYTYSLWTKVTGTYEGLAVMQTTQDWGGLCQYIQVKKGDVLTYSVYAKYTSGTGTSIISWSFGNSPNASYSPATVNATGFQVTITDSWQRFSSTAVATSDGYVLPRIERTTSNTNTLQIAGIKVERGSVATDWCPNSSEILTTSDYAKIKAAIVALGGALS